MIFKKDIKPGMLISVHNEVPMSYYGYWLQPHTMYECLRFGDPAVVTMYMDQEWAYCEFIRNNQLLRASVLYSNMIPLRSPSLEAMEMYDQVLEMTYSIYGEYIYNQEETSTEYLKRINGQ